MAIAEGNKRVNATLDPARQVRLDFLLGLDPENELKITDFFCRCIDKEFVKAVESRRKRNRQLGERRKIC
ncbi:hypothetical protein [Enterococcus hulanensis]|uniref:hypothetical protein n=1 Tax=Enterococcus hulanensis TaxID=2559929 RepID=UPI0010F77D03|nr:hypothetical protein [Enterococcus hulanensis]